MGCAAHVKKRLANLLHACALARVGEDARPIANAHRQHNEKRHHLIRREAGDSGDTRAEVAVGHIGVAVPCREGGHAAIELIKRPVVLAKTIRQTTHAK